MRAFASLSRCSWLLVSGLLATSALAQATKLPYQDASLPMEQRIDDLLSRMTQDEKIQQCHAMGKFRSGGVPRLGVPYLWMADGPQGVREEVGLDSWEPLGHTDDFVTAMPVGMALASTWDSELALAYGKVIGEEARARGKQVMLGPALNIQRTPLCGRTYDYFGEDPWLSGRMTVGYVKGMQAEQTIACMKHFAVNNQENNRGRVNVEVDERTLREIYLPAFEAGVKEGGALSVMGAYNQLRGQHCCHNDYLLNEILKKEWGFKGGVISDWGGAHDTRQSVLYGLDIQMGIGEPYDDCHLGKGMREGLKRGEFPASVLEDKARRNLRMLFASGAVDGQKPGFVNTREHHDTCRRIAAEGSVLLKNGGILPLDPSRYPRILVVGENAVRTFAAGGNAAGVKAFHEITSLQGILQRVGKAADVTFTTGYRQPVRRSGWERDVAGVRKSELDAKVFEENKALAERAVEAAKRADLVIFVGGLSHQAFADDEGVDRKDLSLPSGQDELIARLAAVNPNLVVTLTAGSPVLMPWLDKVPAVMQTWYGGSEAGNALASVLFGDVNPSGKLPCTYPKSLKDIPAHQNEPRTYPGEQGTVHYDEGLMVGYRHFDTQQVEPLFPFGFGLSYTTFRYGALKVVGTGAAAATIECEVTNTGSREGAEVVQLYVQPKSPSVVRPVKELKAFAKVRLKPGETRKLTLSLNDRSFAYYEPSQKGWVAEKGEYGILVGASSRDIRLQGQYILAKGVVLPQ